MKPTLIGMGIFAVSTTVAGSDFWSNVRDSSVPRARQMASVGSAEEEGPLKVFADQASFDVAVGGADVLSVETFNGGATAAGVTNVCSEPMSKVTNDVCFATSDLIDWF
jgi:hypothetical protein